VSPYWSCSGSTAIQYWYLSEGNGDACTLDTLGYIVRVQDTVSRVAFEKE
jgi:hypothetical protein